jgi:hypothetical protein
MFHSNQFSPQQGRYQCIALSGGCVTPTLIIELLDASSFNGFMSGYSICTTPLAPQLLSFGCL